MAYSLRLTIFRTGSLSLLFSLAMALPALGGDVIRVVKPDRPTTKATSRPRGHQPEKGTSLEAARKNYLHGHYELSAKTCRKLLKGEVDRVAVSVALAEALAEMGKYDDAEKALDSVAEPGGADARWQVAKAKLLNIRGQYEQALTHAGKAHRLDPAHAPAIRLHGLLLETLGKPKEALKVYETLSVVIDRNRYLDDPEALVALGEMLEQRGVLRGEKASRVADNALNNYIRRAYTHADKDYWPAKVAAGWFALRKHRTKMAYEEFKGALAQNRHCADAMVGQGVCLLSMKRFEQVLALADKALKANPKHADAHLLKAHCYMRWKKYDEVAPELEASLKLNPNHIQALSLMAALHHVQYEPEKAQPYVQRVLAINPKNAEVYNTIGEQLTAVRQFDLAEKHFKTAMANAPYLAEPPTSLGLLYMQTGQEDRARELLAKAHKLDDYRSDVVNYLKVLNQMADYAVRETEHFIIKVDGKHDAVLLDIVAEYMESIYEEVCSDYSYEPERKTIIEIFPTQQMFSLRLSGRGWIPTVGACTGPVIVLTAPSRGELTPLGTHNWAVVLRHEFTHAVTLGGTRNRIPHWFTEACAVWQQPDKRSYKNVKVLATAMRKNQFMPISELSWGFTRPKRRGQRHLAYQQSELVKDYIIRTHGYDAISKMLTGYREGQTQAEIFTNVLGVSEKQFDKKFQAWAKEEIASWGFDVTPAPDVKKAQAAAKKNPDDADAQAQLAEALHEKGQAKKAAAAAEKALAIDENNELALEVLAISLLKQKEHEKAADVARRLNRSGSESWVGPYVLAAAALKKADQSHRAEAIAALELLKQRHPYLEHSYKKLAELYLSVGLPEKALPNLLHLHRHTMKDPQYAKRIAEIYRRQGDSERALRYYREVLYINPYDAGVYEAISRLHREDGDYQAAIEPITSLTLLDPDSGDAWAKLALIRYFAWRTGGGNAEDRELLEQARQAALKARELEPHGQAGQILQRIDKAIKG